jgi:ribosomal protein S18 acetylase RimI-like enzyme
LEVDTVADNVEYEPYAETRRFYRAMGFQDVRVDEKFWGEGNDRYDRLVMRKDLTR